MLYSLERRFFVLEYRKRHFPGLYYLKKKLEKSPFLGQNHGLSPWEKCELWTFRTSRFYSLEGHFFVLEYRKTHFPGLYYLKNKSWKNGHFWTRTRALPISKKCEFFHFLNFLLLKPREAFFLLEYRKKTFSWPILLKKKKVRNMPVFVPKTMG